MAVDRTFRSLALLTTASTSRVLNLPAISKNHGDSKEFRESVFSWRGFIHYKWHLVDFWRDLVKALQQLKTIVPLRSMDHEQRACITSAKQTILFREFLLRAPALFLEIGEKMGALSPVTSFWKYPFRAGAPRTVDCDELTAIFLDFSKGFTVENTLAA